MMKSKALAVATALLGLTLGACGSTKATRSTGTLQTTVRLEGLTAATVNQVAQVTVSIKSSDPGAPAIAPLVLTTGTNQTYIGTFLRLPVSTNGGPTYDLTAEATDAAGAVLYRGTATQVAVTEQTMATIIIVASSTAPVVHTDYVPVRITAVQAGYVVRSGETLAFNVTVNPDATGQVVIGWTQTGVSDPGTVFSPPNQASTTWTAPTTTIFRTEHITVSASNGTGAPSTVTFDVNVTAKVDAPVSVSLNDPPAISAMALSAPQIAPGGTVGLTVTASDPDGDALTYTFSKGTCAGSLAGGAEGVPQSANFVTFNAGSTVGACQLAVTVTDSHGLTADGVVTLVVGSAPPTRVFIVTPSAPVTLSNVVGVVGDGAPGFEAGSIKATGTPKAELYFTPASLFGHAVTLGDVARMSYWTKKGTTHVVDVHDWFLAIYTTPYAGQTTGWYGARIGAEPYFAANLVETANAWNEWSTDGLNNQLRFFESTNGYFGSTTDPSWTAFVAGSSLTGSHTSVPVPYAGQDILYFSVQTASSAAGFTGQLDGVRIELKDGTVVLIDMQPSPIVPVFDTLPAVLPPNLPSQPFQAQQTAEFGDYITLAPATGRHAAQATVVMVTWATEAYSHPITLNLYSSTAGVLTQIGTRTQTFDIPARPAADPTCPDTGYGAGFAWRASDGKCYNGFAFPITFDLTDVSVVLPDSFAYGIAYNTNTWGYAPIGQPGPYESLNVGVIGDGSTVSSTQPSIGADPDPDTCLRNYWNVSSTPQGYTGFVPEAGWTGYAPAVEFFTY